MTGRLYGCQTDWRSPQARLWKSTRDTSTRKGYEFNIWPEDISLPTHCKYLDVKIDYKSRDRGPRTATVDRIDPTRGYVRGNIQTISRSANLMKQNADISQLLIFALNVRDVHRDGALYTLSMVHIKGRVAAWRREVHWSFPKVCIYTDLKLDYSRQKHGCIPDNAASLDRLDSSKGYIPGNLQIISFLGNKMKNGANVWQLLTFAENVLKIHLSDVDFQVSQPSLFD